jgi:hypothetical protein
VSAPSAMPVFDAVLLVISCSPCSLLYVAKASIRSLVRMLSAVVFGLTGKVVQSWGVAVPTVTCTFSECHCQLIHANSALAKKVPGCAIGSGTGSRVP